MNKKKESTFPSEYRIGMISAFSIMLLTIFLPLTTASDSGVTISISMFSVFSKSNLAAMNLLSLDSTTAAVINILRALVAAYGLLAILGIVCYALDWNSRIREGVIIALIVLPNVFFSSICTGVLVTKAAMPSYADNIVHLGLGSILGLIACGYVFYRPLVYLCMYRTEQQLPETTDGGSFKGVAGAYAGQVIPIGDGETIIIGRNAEKCNLIVNSPKVGRTHCEITYHKSSNTYTLKDYSLNGTYRADGTQYGPEQTLRPGDSFFLSNKENGFQVR